MKEVCALTVHTTKVVKSVMAGKEVLPKIQVYRNADS